MSTTRSTASGRRAATAEPSPRGELGFGIIGTTVGFAIFLILLLFATQVMVRLYAVSALTAAASGAAQQVADSPDPARAVPSAEAAARRQLGSFGAAGSTFFLWKEVDGQRVVLEVGGRSPGFLPLPSSWRLVQRTVAVRTERFR